MKTIKNKKIDIWTLGCFLLLLLLFVACKNDIPETTEAKPALTNLKETSKDSIFTKKLISTSEVKQLLENKEKIAIIEVSKKRKYEEGHLPNAIPLWRPDYENKIDYLYGGMRANQAEIEQVFSGKGINSNQKIIIYDGKGSSDAIRLSWILESYGYHNYFVMNGGKTAWKQKGFPLDTLPYLVKKETDFKFFATENKSKIASFEEVKKAINNPDYILLDTREPEEFRGEPYFSKGEIHEWKKGAYTYGCIPSALHLNWSDMVDLKGDHRIKSLQDLKFNLAKIGVTPNKKIITYCQSGVRSSHTAFVLSEILGYPNVKNYDGSWIEWSYNFVENNNVEVERHTNEAEYARLAAELNKKK